jgi:hypothetical protein
VVFVLSFFILCSSRTLNFQRTIETARNIYPANRINAACNIVSGTMESHKSHAPNLDRLKKPMAIVPLHFSKFGSSDLPSDPAIIHESNKEFISPALCFPLSRDPSPAQIAFPLRAVPNLDRDSGRAALLMELKLIFDRDSRSRAFSLAMASHIKT